MKTQLITPPSVGPVLLEEAKAQLRIETNDEDGFLDICISTATQWAENYLNRSLISQTWELYLDKFTDEIFIPYAPLQSVISIKYYDENNVLQTLPATNYEVDTLSTIGRIRPALGYSWPNTYSKYNSITVQFVAGYGDSNNDVPQQIRNGILYTVYQLMEDRESTKKLPGAVESMLFPYCVYDFGE